MKLYSILEGVMLHKVILGVIGVLILLWFPLTRHIIIFLLPLGVKIDDFVFWVLILSLAGYYFFVYRDTAEHERNYDE